MSTGELTLVDALVGEALLFFKACEKNQRGELTLAEVDQKIDQLAIAIQSIDKAGGSPDDWAEHLFLLSNFRLSTPCCEETLR